MAATQLRLLAIFGRKLITNTIEQLNIALLRVLAKSSNESPRHSTSSLASNLSILTSLIVLTTRPHDDIGGGGLGLLVALVDFVALGGLLDEAHRGGHHAAHITTSVCGDHAEQALTGFLGQVGLLEDTGGGVDIGQVQGGAGVAGIEDCCEADSWLEGSDHDSVHLVVDDVAGSSEINWVDHFVVSIFLITIQIGCLTAVACIYVSVHF